MSIIDTVVGMGNKAAKVLGHHGPTIAVVGGSVAVIAGTVLACRATLKAENIIREHYARMTMIRDASEITEEYTLEDQRKDKIQVYASTVGKFGRLYGPAALLEIAGFTAIFAGFGIIQKRYGIAVSAVTALDKSFSAYRKQVIDEYGAEVDERFTKRRGEFVEVDKIAVNDTEDDDGEPKTEKVEAIDFDDIVEDDFTRIFDSRNPKWENDFLMNDNFLNQTILWYTKHLQSRRLDHVFMNSVLKDFGFKETGVGHFYGWTSKPGCAVNVSILPFIKIWTGGNDKQVPMMIPVHTDEDYDEFRTAYIEDPNSVGYVLKFNVDTDENGIPREIYHEVYGDK